jgi:hypothetical protein
MDSKGYFKTTIIKWKKSLHWWWGLTITHTSKMNLLARKSGQEFTIITNKFETTWLGWDITNKI